MQPNHRIVIVENSAPAHELVVREPIAARFAGTGPARGDYEARQTEEAMCLYIAPGEELTPEERAAIEKFLRYWRVQMRRAA